MPAAAGDEWVTRLARLFRESPAWMAAARHLRPSASSTVYFSHLAREPWHLEQHEDGTRLLPGAASDPDLVFRFTPESIARLETIGGSIGDFAVALFSMILYDDVELRIVAGFGRLTRRGYVKLLLIGGPQVLAFGASRGIRTPGALRRLVATIRSREPADWEA